MKTIIKAVLGNDRGATSVELGLILALIVLAMLTTLQEFAAGNIAMWNNVTVQTANAVRGSGN